MMRGVVLLGLAALASCDDHGSPPPAEGGSNDQGMSTAQLSSDHMTASFGSVMTGTSSPPTRVTITNTGGPDNGESGQISSILAGGNPSSFATAANMCTGKTLGALGTCTIDVTFAPTTVGPQTSTLVVSSSPGGTVEVKLDGDGVVSAR